MDALGQLARLGARFRRRRMERLAALFGIEPGWLVLDVGGTPAIWDLCPVRPRLVILNQPRAREPVPPGVLYVDGDGTALPFADQSFDLVFSNSVIEHLGTAEAMARFAAEVRRTGRRYFVQTPDAASPVEPHLYTPFLHWLPGTWQRALAPRCSFWALLARATADQRDFYLRHYLEEIRLLRAGDLQQLFPEARILRERFCGLPKSLMAVCGACSL
jgi:hypothetical protein